MKPHQRIYTTALSLALLALGYFLLRTRSAPEQSPSASVLEVRQPAQSISAPVAGQPGEAPAQKEEVAATEVVVPSVPAASVQPIRTTAPISEFANWARDYVNASQEQRAQMEPRGIALAEARRPVFKQLIIDDPQQAILDAVPRVVRQDLPASVVSRLEKPVSTKGDYNVYLGRPAPGTPVPKEGLALRYFEADGVSYKAHVYGELKPVMSKKNIPLQGYAMDRELAVAENAVRPLEMGERIASGVTVSSTCPVSGITTETVSEGQTVTPETPAVEIAGSVVTLCNGSHVKVLEDDFRTYVQASGPGGGGFFLENFPGTSSRAIGNLRCLYIRVTYPDQMAEPNTMEQAYADMRDNARFYLEGSYGKLTQTTTVTSLLVLPHTVAWYKAKDADVDGLGLVHSDSRAAAKAAGYDTSQYDCIIVRVNKGPRLEGISWGGGTSVWITWNGMDVLNHEVGHSLGRNHANSWTSLDGTPYGYGENAEYGNPFDVMGGGGGFSAHYNVVSKRALGWLPDSYMHLAKVSGVYRIYAYDQPTLEAGKRYGLNVAKDSVRQYNLEFHPARGGFLANSALVIYSGMGSNAGHLLDTTQNSENGKNDGGIAVGRTFSDWEADMHFTVLSKNDTEPASLDIAYNRGPFPGNEAPTVALAASATSIAVNGSVTFTATAADANGDPLAYEWWFSDGQGGTNSPSFTRTFTSAAQVTVIVTVSDMKGGTARASVVIGVGSHGKQTITGTITDGTDPLAGVHVTNGTQQTYTNSDGSYSLAGISTGSQTLTASLPGYTFTPAFTNPLAVVAGTNTANWTAAAETLVTLTKLSDPAEGGASGKFRLTRTGDTTAALTVLVSPASGTAVKGTDYTFSPDYVTSGSFRSFTIPAAASTLDITVAATNDTTKEGPETINLQLAGAASYFTTSASFVTMTVADNDTALPQVAVAAPVPYAAEGTTAEPGTFVFTRTGDTTASLALTVAWSGTATSTADYTLSPATVVIPAGQSSLTVNVNPVNDNAGEVPETVIATISANAAYVLDSGATAATVTLTDDDQPVVSVSVADASANESGDAGLFLITRTGSTAAALKVYYGVSGSALHGTDYAPLNGEVTIPAGSASAPVVISPYDDEHGEPVETVTLAVATFNDSYSIGSVFQGSVSITDNADAPLVNVRAGSTGTEGGTNPTVIFHTIGSGTGNVTVNYTVSGTAASGSDFTALSGTISVPAGGSTDTTLTIPLINDTAAEPTETVVIRITPSSSYRVYDDGFAEAVILDNDSGGDRVSVSTANESPAESGTVAGTFYFSRTLSTGALTVNYSMGGTATNGTDYTTLSGTVVIPDGATGVDLTMTPINDTAVEGTETVTLTVLPGAGYSVDRPASATYEIADNETPALTVGFQQASMVTSELPGALGEYRDIPVVLSAVSTVPVTVSYESSSGTATGDDVDWGFVDADNGNVPIQRGVLTFLPGVTTQNIRVRVKQDNVREAGETATLLLKSPFNAALTANKSQLGLLIFDDVIPALATEERWSGGTVYTNNTWNTATPVYTGYLASFTSAQNVGSSYSRRITGQIVAPATGAYTFWIASDDASRLYLSTTSSAANKVQIASLSGAVSFQNWDSNASQKSASINLVAGQSYYMEVQQQEGSGDDHVSVAWQGPGFSRIPISLNSSDNAPRFVRMAKVATSRVETDGNEPMLMAVLDRPAGSTAVTVDYSTAGTATAGADYTLPAGTLTFSAGEQMKLIPLSILTDAVGESPETIVVALSNPVGASLGAPATHTITILDADAMTVDTQFVNAASTQAANTVITVATANPAPGHTITDWVILSGNTGGAFSINASGELKLATPSALPNPGGMQISVRATDNTGITADGVINVICNAGTSAVVERRWSGATAFDNQNWTGTTNYSGKLATLTTTQNVADNYSRRLTGYLKPAASGDYTFWIAGDDDCRLFLSTDGYEANKVQIAYISGWTSFQSWDQDASQKSAAISLEAGKVYWIEAHQKEGGGGDHLSVAWSGPGISRVAIPASVMVPTASGISFTAPNLSVVNTAPTVSNVTNKTVAEDSSGGSVNFTVGDAETPAASLTVSVTSSNQALVPLSGLTLGGSGTARTLEYVPAVNQAGTATITITVSDGMLTASDSFVLTVTASNDAPQVSAIADQTVTMNTSSNTLPFTVNDRETAASALTITRVSSNPALVPVSGIAVNGSGISRTTVVTPSADVVGSATITLQVSDGTTTTSTSFVVNVPGTNRQLWRSQYFGTINAIGDAADSLDYDGDGLNNFMEYALGRSPTDPSATSGSVIVDRATISGSTYMRMTVFKNPNATDVGYVVEANDDPANPAGWSTAGTVVESSTANQLVVRDSTAIGSKPRRTLRLKATGL